MSALVGTGDRREGLWPLLEARRAGRLDGVRAMAPALERPTSSRSARSPTSCAPKRSGDLVRIYANVRPEPSAAAVEVPRRGRGRRRRDAAPARRRDRADHRARARRDVRVDWAEIGLELAQVALGFGASELVGPIANKRGLAIADDATKKVKGAGMVSLQAMKQRELAGLVRRSGRRVVVIGPSGVEPEPPRAPDTVETAESA